MLMYKNPVLILTLAGAWLFSACADTPDPRAEMSEDQACETIQKIISAYPAKFAGYRRNQQTNVAWQSADIWTAESFFPDTTCQIWGWGKGLANYSCEWRETDHEAAEAAYRTYRPKIAQCLGSAWTATDPETKTGHQTVFKNPTTRAVVSIRYYQDTRRAIVNPWYTSMIIGDLVRTLESN